MTDYFALLGLPRRPGLDEEALKENYLRLAAAWHPDAAGGAVEKFRDLQEARKTLLNPASRLRHLLALEGFEGRSGGSFQPPTDLFLEVAGVLDAAKKAVGKFETVHSAIARAAQAAEWVKLREKIARTMDAVTCRRTRRLKQIEEVDAAWPEKDLRLLEEISGELVFLNRWEKELREALFPLNARPGT